MASIARVNPLTRTVKVSTSLLSNSALALYIGIHDPVIKIHAKSTKIRARQIHIDTGKSPTDKLPTPLQLLTLPRSCPGCGAFTQFVSPGQAGFYSTDRKSVKAFVAHYGQASGVEHVAESEMFDRVLGTANSALLSQMGLREAKNHDTEPLVPKAIIAPVCNRCHDLTHHHTGVPVIHPTIQTIQNIISESPHKYNHIYHVLDAADFPLSLIPLIQRHLSLSPQRSLNRRAKTSHFQYGRKAEMSFVITRSDLLAPKKEQVDSLMPYFLQVLRDALGGSAESVRLGNVHCVSSKRGWWTTQVKEDIWTRGGGGWMVGKVNVGKSNLLENVFPKGRNEDISFAASRHAALRKPQSEITAKSHGHPTITGNSIETENCRLTMRDENHVQSLGDSLLPPAPLETPFPVLPLVSSLPGTTASPIRLPYGGGKGELVDLPGLSRGDLENFVKEDHKLDLLMRHRIKPKQVTIKPGQSLLVGGLVRITPTTSHLTFLAYPFVPLECHVTSTEKAISIHTQREDSGVPTIARPGIGSRMDPAGSFSLRWDVTKQRAGPLTRKDAGGLNPKVLSFQVFSADILIEGCGWIELVAQSRKKDMESVNQPGNFFDPRPYPRVEVFSPDGRHVGVRQPMGAWLLGGRKPGSSSSKAARPRRSMKGVKKELKKVKRGEVPAT